MIAAEFPIAAEAVYLNHAASAPLPTRSADALRRYVDDRQALFKLYQAGKQDYDTTALREKLGRLLIGDPERVGFVPTTMDGVSGVLNGIPWKPGDNVVLAANEFPGLVYAALNLERRQVEPRLVPLADRHLDLETLLAAADQRTRAVVVSHVHWQTGHSVDIGRLGRACRDRGILSIVDGIQSLGAVPTDLAASDVDVFVAGTYKWLLATQGLAVIHLSARALEAIVPDRAGWTSVEATPFGAPEFRWAAGARRFAVGGAADPALIALEQSVDLLLEIGVERIADHTRAMIDRMVAGFTGLGLTVNTCLDRGARSSIVSVTTGDRTRDGRLTRALVADRIIVAERGPGIRVSPHIHTTAEGVDRFLAAIAAFR